MAVTDSIILELLSRVQKCEREIQVLNQRIDFLNKNQPELNYSKKDLDENIEDNSEDESFLTRGPARELIMKEMRKLIPNTTIRAANRSEGSGIFISGNSGDKKIKMYHSRCYDISSENVISWSGVQKNDVDYAYDGYIFSIWCNKQLYVLLFTHKDLKNLISSTNKSYDTQEKYHFSFTVKPNLQVFETRGPEHVDVTYALDNYEIIK